MIIEQLFIVDIECNVVANGLFEITQDDDDCIKEKIIIDKGGAEKLIQELQRYVYE